MSDVATKAAQPIHRRRPKHDPRASEQEILRAAEELIREQPLRDITVGAIMSRTGLKRPAFYTHFRDLSEVLIRITERITQDLVGAAQQWLLQSSTSERDLIEALERASRVYAEHTALLRALADAAPSDAQAEAAFASIIDRLVAAVAERIRAEQAAGSIAKDVDPEETGRALTLMNERYLYHAMGREPRPDVKDVVRVLSQIWLATLYGTRPDAPAAPSGST
jgi:AcrR family transcriptional regulator